MHFKMQFSEFILFICISMKKAEIAGQEVRADNKQPIWTKSQSSPPVSFLLSFYFCFLFL